MRKAEVLKVHNDYLNLKISTKQLGLENNVHSATILNCRILESTV